MRRTAISPRVTGRVAVGGRARLGQNFLVDRRVAGRIVDAAGIGPQDDVLEIGPGRGALTRLLAARCRWLVAVELDTELAATLSSALSGLRNVEVIAQDALEFDPARYFSDTYKLVANLPYYVATPTIRRYLNLRPRPSEMTVMVQREVADRIVASPGKMSFLSVLVQMHATARVAFNVPPRAFRPTPKVNSTVVRIVPHKTPALPVEDHERFIAFAAAGFRAPRKQLRNSLRMGLEVDSDVVDRVLSNLDIDGRRRPADLSLSEWGELYTAWKTQERS